MEKKYVVTVLVSVAFWGGVIFFTKKDVGSPAFSVENTIGEADKVAESRQPGSGEIGSAELLLQERAAQETAPEKEKQQVDPVNRDRRQRIPRAGGSGSGVLAMDLGQEIIYESQTGAVPKEKIQQLKEMVEANDPEAIEATRFLLDQVTDNAIQHELLRTLARNGSDNALEGVTEVLEKKKNEPTEVSRILSYVPLGAHREFPRAIVDELHSLMQQTDIQQPSYKVISRALLQRGGEYGREVYQAEMKKKEQGSL